MSHLIKRLLAVVLTSKVIGCFLSLPMLKSILESSVPVEAFFKAFLEGFAAASVVTEAISYEVCSEPYFGSVVVVGKRNS